MGIDGEPRGEKIEASATVDVDGPERSGAATSHGARRTGLVLGTLAALLIVAGAVYYFADPRAGTEVATGSGSERPAESPTVASNPRAVDGAEKQASSTTSEEKSPVPPAPSQGTTSMQPQSPQPNEPQQSANATPPSVTGPAPAPATPPAVIAAPSAVPATSPTTTAQNETTNSQATKSEPSPDATKAAPSTAPGAGTQAGSTAQPSMRDQPAALPDQAAVAPKKENVLVVMRGPANIRSAPGKNGRVIGTVPKEAVVKELDRSGNWVQVETDAGTGWINAALLGSPESR